MREGLTVGVWEREEDEDVGPCRPVGAGTGEEGDEEAMDDVRIRIRLGTAGAISSRGSTRGGGEAAEAAVGSAAGDLDLWLA